MHYDYRQYPPPGMRWPVPRPASGRDSGRKSEPTEVRSGRYDLQGDDIYMNVMRLSTQPAQSKKAELHEKFIDIQILLEGEEIIHYGVTGSTRKCDAWHKEDDYQLCAEIAGQQQVVLEPRYVCHLLPR